MKQYVRKLNLLKQNVRVFSQYKFLGLYILAEQRLVRLFYFSLFFLLAAP